MTDDFQEAGKKFNLRKLVVIDTLADTYSPAQLYEHFKGNPDVEMLFIDSYAKLTDGFSSLLLKGELFNRVLFETHGHAGVFYAGATAVGPYLMKNDFVKYAALFPFYTRIYFSGCDISAQKDEYSNPSANDAGFDFLKAVGETLLRFGGGEVLAYDGEGLTLPWYMFFVGGHTVHSPRDVLTTMYFKPGGFLYRRVPDPMRRTTTETPRNISRWKPY